MSKGIKHATIDEGQEEFVDLNCLRIQELIKSYEKDFEEIKKDPSWERKLQSEKRLSERERKESVLFFNPMLKWLNQNN